MGRHQAFHSHSCPSHSVTGSSYLGHELWNMGLPPGRMHICIPFPGAHSTRPACTRYSVWLLSCLMTRLSWGLLEMALKEWSICDRA